MAIPPLAVAAPPPVNVPLPGFVPMASVTVVVLSVVTRFPFVSSTLTVTAGLIVAPPTALVGCCKNTSFEAVPATKVCAPPAVVDPDFEPLEKLKSVVAKALTLKVFPTVAPAAISAVIYIYPGVPTFIACDKNEGNVFAPAVPGVVYVLNTVPPPVKVLVV